MATPSNKVYLLSGIDINSDYLNTYKFANRTAQYNFFVAKTQHSFTNLTFVRKDSAIRVGKNIESLFNVSYVMFQNTEYGSRWYYAFIDDLKFINKTTTEVKFTIDVMQTWGVGLSDGDITMLNSFIEREHTLTDEVGDHIVDEDLWTGEMISNDNTDLASLKPLTIVLTTSDYPDYTNPPTLQPPIKLYGGTFSGVYQGIGFIVFDNDSAGRVALNSLLEDFETAGISESVVNIFIVPKAILPSYTNGEILLSISTVPSENVLNVVSKPYTDIDGYTPVNKKLFVYPYNFLRVTNNQGGFSDIHYELCSDNDVTFNISGEFTGGTTLQCRPKNYKGEFDNVDESITLTGYPNCAWSNDAYKNWFAQNRNMNYVNVLTNALSTRPLAESTPSIVGSTARLIGTIKDKQNLPNVNRGSVGGSSSIAIDKMTYTFKKMTIREETAKIIDAYFSKFGYKVNRLATPSFNNRPSWTYIKLGECCLKGNVPNSDKEKIINNLLNGITFWNGDYVGDYSRNNAPT